MNLTKRRLLLLAATVVIISHAVHANSRLLPGEFIVTPIAKSVGEFALKIDQSSPLDLYLSTEYIAITGRSSLWSQINSYQFRFDTKTADRTVSEESRQRILETVIHEVVVYKDTAAVLVQPASEVMSGYPILVQLCRREGGLWVNAGQDIGTSVEAAREKFAGWQAQFHLERLAVVERLKKIQQDAAPFVANLRENGKAPVDFLLDALTAHKIVIWGEVHRRRASWNVLKDAVRDPRFARTAGTVFMELPSHAQARMDSFFASKKMDVKIVYGIFRDLQVSGWFDRGELEFIVELWKLNRSLPAKKRIKVFLTDFQAPYSELQTEEEFRNYPRKDRNTHMADVIERTLRSSCDSRGSLFIVGYMHAYKSSVPGIASTPHGMGSAPTAGAQLAERFPDGMVFTIFQHSAMMTNSGPIGGLIRDGIFDDAFAATGNAPVGFPLAGSPFGAEPFDAAWEMDLRMGSFADNFDGYVFFAPLVEEEGEYCLYDIVDQEFAGEIKRRIVAFGLNGWYGGIKADELTPQRIIDRLKSNSTGKRWARAFEN